MYRELVVEVTQKRPAILVDVQLLCVSRLLFVEWIGVGEVTELVALQILQDVPLGRRELERQFQELKVEILS